MKKVSIWQITATSLDDGHRIRMGYFLDRQKADTRCAELPKKMEAAVLEFDCLQDEKGNYYAIPDRPLDVSDAKDAILNKLTKDERAILGV